MPQLPIVLAHGYLGFGVLGPVEYFNGVADALTSLGATQIYSVSVPPKGSLAERSAALAEQIRANVPNGKVHLIAHSMGGLDARYLISHGNGSDLVASLATLGSPFRGTFAADVAADPLRLKEIPAANLLKAIASLGVEGAAQFPQAVGAQLKFGVDALREAWGRAGSSNSSNLSAYFRGLLAMKNEALPELTTASCQLVFPQDESDLKGIPACSYAGQLGSAAVSPFLGASAVVLEAAGQPNDGIVPVVSATLKDHRATLAVDHLGLVGWSPTNVLETYREIYRRLPG